MTWFNLLKIEFIFDPELPLAGSSVGRNPRTFLNLSRYVQRGSEEQDIKEIIDIIIHESAHEAFDDVAFANEFKKPFYELGDLVNNAFKNSISSQIGADPPHPPLDEERMDVLIQKILEYMIITEMYASYSGGQEATSRIIAERYPEDKIEYLINMLKKGVDEYVDSIREAAKVDAGTAARFEPLLSNSRRHIFSLIELIGELYLVRAKVFLERILIREIQNDKEPGQYKDILVRILNGPNGYETLHRYLDTGDMSIVRPYMGR